MLAKELQWQPQLLPPSVAYTVQNTHYVIPTCTFSLRAMFYLSLSYEYECVYAFLLNFSNSLSVFLFTYIK